MHLEPTTCQHLQHPSEVFPQVMDLIAVNHYSSDSNCSSLLRVGLLADGPVLIEFSKVLNLRPMAQDQLADHWFGPVQAFSQLGLDQSKASGPMNQTIGRLESDKIKRGRGSGSWGSCIPVLEEMGSAQFR